MCPLAPRVVFAKPCADREYSKKRAAELKTVRCGRAAVLERSSRYVELQENTRHADATTHDWIGAVSAAVCVAGRTQAVWTRRTRLLRCAATALVWRHRRRHNRKERDIRFGRERGWTNGDSIVHQRRYGRCAPHKSIKISTHDERRMRAVVCRLGARWKIGRLLGCGHDIITLAAEAMKRSS